MLELTQVKDLTLNDDSVREQKGRGYINQKNLQQITYFYPFPQERWGNYANEACLTNLRL